jgi:cytochrome P450
VLSLNLFSQTVSALTSFILLIALYPEIQKQAQQEISNFCGYGRQPAINDLHDLPYLHALYKEVLRYAPVANIGRHFLILEALNLQVTNLASLTA